MKKVVVISFKIWFEISKAFRMLSISFSVVVILLLADLVYRYLENLITGKSLTLNWIYVNHD